MMSKEQERELRGYCHEAADLVINANGYADGYDESNNRATAREELEADLYRVAVGHAIAVKRFGGDHELATLPPLPSYVPEPQSVAERRAAGYSDTESA